jgi:hypothetical protein
LRHGDLRAVCRTHGRLKHPRLLLRQSEYRNFDAAVQRTTRFGIVGCDKFCRAAPLRRDPARIDALDND